MQLVYPCESDIDEITALGIFCAMHPNSEVSSGEASLHCLSIPDCVARPLQDPLPDVVTGVVEGESEIVAGHMIEYSGMSFAMFFLAEYANMILVSMLSVIMFLGGWLSPFDNLLFNWVPGWIWLGLKTFVVVTMFLWVRASFPRYRYDQIMRLGWKIFIPVTLVWLVVVGLWIESPWNIWA